MRCSEFREHHCAFVDDTLAGVELVRMQGHVTECAPCAELDARVRRSLMWVRSLPRVEPSAEFRHKLEAKLQACREEGLRVHEATGSNFRAVAAIGAVASLLMMGYMAESLHVQRANSRGAIHETAVARDIVLPPVIAMAVMPAAIPSSGGRASRTLASSASAQHGALPPAEIVSGSGRGVVPVSGSEPVAPEIIASVSAGMPLWPAALFAEQAPLHYANLRKPVH
jgi:hypothetical protein